METIDNVMFDELKFRIKIMYNGNLGTLQTIYKENQTWFRFLRDFKIITQEQFKYLIGEAENYYYNELDKHRNF